MANRISQPDTDISATPNVTDTWYDLNALPATTPHTSLKSGLSPYVHVISSHPDVQLLPRQKMIPSENPAPPSNSPSGFNVSGNCDVLMKPHNMPSPCHHRAHHSNNNMHASPIGRVTHANRFGTNIMSIPPGPAYSYSHAPKTRYGDQQSSPRRKIQVQINYLNSLAAQIPTHNSFKNELQANENLRLSLTNIAQKALERYAKEHDLEMGPKTINLKCFGSLRNGFTLPGSNIDLALSSHTGVFPAEFEVKCPQILNKAFLDAGLIARVITNTRVPIIRICGRPSSQPCDAALDAEDKEFEKKHKNLSGTTYKIPPRLCTSRACPNGSASNPGFPELDVGIHCDVSLSGRSALYNTELLRCYALCDERVRLVGIFVKMWAKAREINHSYRGTLCSYGWVLLVIHYLMNVAYPPLVPNLQLMSQLTPRQSGNMAFGRYNPRFFNSEAEPIARAWSHTKSGNQQSVGELLNGFFAYYGSGGHGAPLGGFNWTRKVVSIRTRGGLLSKQDKGWTSARTDENGYRLRFLLAIEDPFELTHNVGETVTWGGLNTIKEEFRRAIKIIHRVQEIPGAGWEWRTESGELGQDFLAAATNHKAPQHKEKDSSSVNAHEAYSNGIEARDTPGLQCRVSTTYTNQKTDPHSPINDGLKKISNYKSDLYLDPPTKVQERRVQRDNFRQQATSGAGTMCQSLHLSKYQTIDNPDCAKRSPKDFEIIGEKATNSSLLGVPLDSRQFNSTDRIHVGGLPSTKYITHLAKEQVSARMELRGALVPDHDLLAILPFYEKSVC